MLEGREWTLSSVLDCIHLAKLVSEGTTVGVRVSDYLSLPRHLLMYNVSKAYSAAQSCHLRATCRRLSVELNLKVSGDDWPLITRCSCASCRGSGAWLSP